VWSNQGSYNTTAEDDENWMNLGDRTTDFFIAVYGGIAFTFYALVAWRSLLMVAFQINTSRFFHSAMLESTLRATMAFFETTPAGQILNRTVRVFRQKFTLEDTIGSHACSLEALPCA
jgi:ABC-type multidrug transport system fused ATPase/permease subunit